ncbi:N-acetylmuramoyl-L-alanine amidase [Nocardioides donggukensis]|uniref:N-acetylmuramoyl-L-alanine amidase n=1 Tax=Nocardioides donggukensis TaxID=2774019 RepID=A0A927K255_9ACTN|nr:N-acetylmuramoyl-L-alanine amidase [Nocardioides donggukensis]MBD8868342.1 N-acetylmuramoyl-L-alanine amidase [Nocardioides donggukensis]
MVLRGLGLSLAAGAALVAAVLPAVPVGEPRPSSPPTRQGVEPGDPGGVLAGRTVLLDPGHQLGNARFPAETSRPVPAGGFEKACNTDGAATAGGYPEATFTMAVARLLRVGLREHGARVVMTRTRDRADLWGPCVDERGRAGQRAGADVALSIHADGSTASSARGFHVIAPGLRPTDPAVRESLALARTLRTALRAGGLPVADYVAGGDGLDRRDDLATLNLARVPVALVELGNMRSPRDARRMTSPAGRTAYASALLDGLVRHLGR